jgi:cysteine desulfurase / selenocysteine lyase
MLMKKYSFLTSLILVILIILVISISPHSGQNYRNMFKKFPNVPLLNGTYSEFVNLDASASTLPFQEVCKKIDDFTRYYSNIHRGHGYLSKVASSQFDESRKIILDFVGASREKYMCIFGKNTSECINKLAYCFTSQTCKCKSKNVILLTEMEHHSNILPWIKNQEKIVEFIKIDEFGFLDISDLKNKIDKYGDRISIISVTGGSNVTGIVNDLSEITKLSKSVGAMVCVDGAQLIPHRQMEMEKLGIDFLCFSGHKMYSPFGLGCLIGPKEFFNDHIPCFSGGGEVELVVINDISDKNTVLWKDNEERHEEGTQNIIGVIALSESIKILNRIGMENVKRHEDEMYKYAFDKASLIPNVNIVSPHPSNEPLGILSFYIGGLHQGQVGAILDYEYGIGCRSGCLCASPYVKKLLGISDVFIDELINQIKSGDKRHISGVVRVSFSLYTTKLDIDKLCNALHNITQGNYSSYGQNIDGTFIPEIHQKELIDYNIFS